MSRLSGLPYSNFLWTKYRLIANRLLRGDGSEFYTVFIMLGLHILGELNPPKSHSRCARHTRSCIFAKANAYYPVVLDPRKPWFYVEDLFVVYLTVFILSIKQSLKTSQRVKKEKPTKSPKEPPMSETKLMKG